MMLLLAIAALFAPALAAGGLVRRPGVGAVLDGFVLVAIGWLVLTDVAPEALQRGGLAALAALVVGIGGPWLAERLGLTGATVHGAGVVVGHVALVVHAALDGVALAAAGSEPGGDALAAAVILHQVPVGLAVWANVRARLGAGAALLALGVMALVTAAGAFGGASAFASAGHGLGGDALLAVAEALSAGTLLHVVAHAPLPGAGGRPQLAGAGGLAAVTLMLLAEGLHALSDVHMDPGQSFFLLGPAEHATLLGAVSDLVPLAAPGVLVGMLVSAGMEVWRPDAAPALRRLPPSLAAGLVAAFGPVIGGIGAAAWWVSGVGGAPPADAAAPTRVTPTPRAALFAAVDADAPGLVLALYLGGSALLLGGPVWTIATAVVLALLRLPPTARLFLAVALAQCAPLGANAPALAVGLLVAGRHGLPFVGQAPLRAVALALLAGLLAFGALFVLGSDARITPLGGTLAFAASIVLALLLAGSLLRRGPRGWIGAEASGPDAHDHAHDHAH